MFRSARGLKSLFCLLFAIVGGALVPCALASSPLPRAQVTATLPPPAGPVHIPLLLAASQPPQVTAHDYGSLTVFSTPTDRPAEEHADLCLALRGYAPVDAACCLLDYNGSTDGGAPYLGGLLGTGSQTVLDHVYAVYDWDWGLDARAGLITQPPVTLIGLETSSGQPVYAPPSGYDIGSGYTALVLYASPSRVTLKYTREDNVILGYTVHLEHLVVHPSLVALYQACDAAGRGVLPAVRGGELLGVAEGEELGVGVRDCGAFMDPRSRKDWW